MQKKHMPEENFHKNIYIRTMTLADLRMVTRWAATESWNPGKYEVEPLYAADSNGYRLLEVDGEPVASLAGVRHSDYFAFLGLYIVKPELRGHGYGKLLWNASMEALKDCPTIGLNGILEQINNYQQEGFLPYELITRWRGKAPEKFAEEGIAATTKIELTKAFSLTHLIDYDAQIFSTRREAFLLKWLKMPESHVLAAMEGSTIRGYGVISVCEEGHKIAPLFADSKKIAEKLYLGLCQIIGSPQFVQLDTPENNSFASSLAKRFGLTKMFDTMRMYKGNAPMIDDKKTFGLATLEIG